MLLGPSLHLPLEVAGMNIWQVLQCSVQLPKGSPAGRQLPPQQQDLLQPQAATNRAPVALQAAEIRSSTASAAWQQQQSATTAASLAAEATATLLPVDLAIDAASEAVNAAAVVAEAGAGASAPVSCGSSSIASSSNMVLVQLHVLTGGHVQVQLVVPSARADDPAAAAAKQPLTMDAAADAAAAAAADRVMSAGQRTHYTPTIGRGRLVTGCWDAAGVHQQRTHLAVAQQTLWPIVFAQHLRMSPRLMCTNVCVLASMPHAV
jgi:hypothetical protein